VTITLSHFKIKIRTPNQHNFQTHKKSAKIDCDTMSSQLTTLINPYLRKPKPISTSLGNSQITINSQSIETTQDSSTVHTKNNSTLSNNDTSDLWESNTQTYKTQQIETPHKANQFLNNRFRLLMDTDENTPTNEASLPTTTINKGNSEILPTSVNRRERNTNVTFQTQHQNTSKPQSGRGNPRPTLRAKSVSATTTTQTATIATQKTIIGKPNVHLKQHVYQLYLRVILKKKTLISHENCIPNLKRGSTD
jgi:hypothetical protein